MRFGKVSYNSYIQPYLHFFNQIHKHNITYLLNWPESYLKILVTWQIIPFIFWYTTFVLSSISVTASNSSILSLMLLRNSKSVILFFTLSMPRSTVVTLFTFHPFLKELLILILFISVFVYCYSIFIF